MNIDNIIKVERIKKKHAFMEKCTILTFFHIGFFINGQNGKHLSFIIGIGPFETEISFRLWLTRKS
jgi:hypothetical protein